MESLTRPAHRRKLSNASGVFSFSSKNVYDDVFAVPSPAAAAAATKFKAPVGVETYGEIFGSSRGSSIPVLDLSVLKDKRTGLEDHRSSSKLDYAKIFGGFGDEAVTAVPYEELFGDKGKKCSSDKAAMGKESPLRGSDNHSLSEKGKGHSSEASDQSVDAVKQVNMSYHKSSQRNKDGPSGTRHIAKLQAIPGFAYFIDETDRQQKAEGDRPVPSTKNDVQRACSFNTHENNNGKKTEMPMPDTVPSTKNDVQHACSFTTHENNNGKKTEMPMPDIVRQQKAEGDRPVPSIKSEVQRTWSFSGNIQEENNGRKTEMPMPNTVYQQKTEGDRPVPSIKSEVQRIWSFSGNIQEDNNGRKTEMPVPNILTSEGVNKGKRGSWLDGSRSNDKLFNSGEISSKSQSFKFYPSSSPPAKLNDIKGHPKRSRSLSFASKANASEKSGDYLTGSSDEELDMNSAAAASAAALRKAIEQAQESIRLAKELMERKKDGSQGHSNPIPKARDRKESRTDQDANNIKKNSAQVTCERFDNVFQGFIGINRKPTLQTNEIAAPFAHSDNISASRRVEVEKHQKNVVEIHETKAWLSDLGNYGNDRSMTSATGQIQNKITTKEKQACDIDEIKKSEETLARMENNVEKTKIIEQVFVLGNEESRNNVHQEVQAQESKETANEFNSAHMVHECGGSEDILIGHIRNGFDELEESEEKFQECLDINEEEKLVPPRLEDQNLMEEEKVPDETFQGRNMETEPEKDKENDTGRRKNSSEGGGMVNEEVCLFVEEEDKPIAVVGDRSNEKAHEDTQEGEHSDRSHRIEEKDVDEMVVIHAHKKEGTQRILAENVKEEEAEDLDLNEIELTDAHDGNKSKNIHSEEQERGEVPRGLEETYHHANQNIPEEAFEQEEVEKQIEEAYLDEATESLWIEADKSTENQKAEVTQEAEEAESVHLEADNNQDISSLQKAACRRNSNTAFGTLRELHEPSRFDVSNANEKTSAADNYEDNCGAPAVNETLYQCERDADEEEESVKEASKLEEKETSETGHCVQHANQEHVIPSGMQSDPEAVASDENGANVQCNEINHAHTLPKDNTFKAVDLRNAVKENGTNIKMQDASDAHLCDEKSAHTGSSENSRHKEIEENVEEETSCNPNTFDVLVHNSGETPENVSKEAEVAFDKEESVDVKVGNEKRNMEEYSEEEKSIPLPSQSTRNQESRGTSNEMKTVQNLQHAEEFLGKTGAVEEKELRDTKQNEVKESNETRKIEANKREREWNTDRIAVERVIREARERAFAEARERAERAAVERASAEVRQRVMAEARGKLDKATIGSKADKASSEAKLKAERAAVERATSEARERALEKALSHKSTAEARVQAERLSGVSRDNGLKHSFSSSDLENLDGTSSESAQRRKARLERHQRIMERAAKALEEKNTRDRLAQKEQAERNRLAETLDADVKRWASGKERNLRALLSTLQYILGPDSGWQPISLTEIITTVDVKKAYRKATLCVHPDKLQQRGASIHQKYICEKVFDLLKAAWNRFNSEER